MLYEEDTLSETITALENSSSAMSGDISVNLSYFFDNAIEGHSHTVNISFETATDTLAEITFDIFESGTLRMTDMLDYSKDKVYGSVLADVSTLFDNRDFQFVWDVNELLQEAATRMSNKVYEANYLRGVSGSCDPSSGIFM